MPSGNTAVAGRRRSGQPLKRAIAGAAVVVGVVATTAAMMSTAAAASPYEKGPNPTAQSIAATTGPFATASVTVARQSNFGGGVIYYPTDTSQGTFGGVAISPGLNGTWPGIAWLGPRLSSQGFVVFGIDTLALNDSPASRGTQLLAALDYLTQVSSVRTRVDAGRLAVAGHSMGGGGALEAALRRPTLWAAIPNAPFFQGNASNVRVPTLITAMQNDGLVGQNRNTYNAIPAGTEKAYVELAGAGHNQIGQPTTAIARNWIPWLKIFLDQDARYQQFLCPTTNMTGLSQYLNTCPLITAAPTSTSSPPTSTNRALNRPAVASSVESSAFPASNAVDASTTTRWSSAFSDPQWIYVDLGQTYAINRVRLVWETAYGSAYQIQTSNNATTWTTVRSITGGNGGVDDNTALGAAGRYVRINGTTRGTQWGYSLFTFEVYGG
jgi:dienelactone hydrolase